ncbi:MAG: hybrid sensor histidine kinase/response regulator [Myxococcales bacterium]|nr:hybrid sensor histidine kinase/response regulator [Myxococcales bacterium]MDD9970960.1 hybrid sensor histidine kinase/response regulator [Myxococcales bacterium]
MPRAASKVLVVDDNPQNIALAQATLEDSDFDVVTAESGAEGLDAFDAERPDCVLLDVRMPGMDGFAVCRALRQRPEGSDVPVVFLTAQRDLETFDEALRAGADDFLAKPFQPAQLVVRVRATLRMKQLDSELREHYELAKRQRDELMRLQLQKERLTAFVVHDLKNPVNAMDLHAQLLLRAKDLPERARDSASRIRAEAKTLLRLVYNLLDIQLAEAGQLVPTYAPVDMGELVGKVTQEFGRRADEAGVELIARAAQGQLQADGDLIRRVVENLVDNALRHAPRGTTVEVQSTVDDTGADIRVSDQGPGIPADMRDRVFDRFVQVASGERVVSRAGRGLGLSFCKAAVEAHQGTIWIEDGDPGTIFCVRLPCHE